MDAKNLRWSEHGDLLRTQIQETGRIRIAFLTLADLAAAMDDLGINFFDVRFEGGYAVVRTS